MNPALFLFFLYFLYGLCIGSFLNVVVYRLPLKLPIAKGRSMCPQCGTTLRAKDLVPVLSFVFLKGKCRYCGAPISYRYPGVELLTGILFGLSGALYGLNLYSVLLCLLACVLLVAWFIDLDQGYIPDRLHLILLALAACSLFTGPQVPWTSRLIGAGAVGGGMLLISLITKGGIGGGDIKLMACCGLLLGWEKNLPAFFLAYILAALCWLPALLTKEAKPRTEVPMAPYFAVSVLFFALFGDWVIPWYLSLFS